MSSIATPPRSDVKKDLNRRSSSLVQRTPFIYATLVLVSASALVFLIPLIVPMKPVAIVSDSYLAGFNNSVAVLFAVALSFLVLTLTLWQRRSAPSLVPTVYDPLRWPFVAVVLLASSAVIAVEGWLVTASHQRYLGDVGYFLEQATVRRNTGFPLYTNLEFAYGPLLLLPEVWLSRLFHGSIPLAYYITLIVESVLGLLFLVYLLNVLPIRPGLRKAAFVLFAAGALVPHVGLNYTYFRFLTPFALLMLATRSRSVLPTAVWLSVSQVAVLLISPELGLAMAFGVCAFGLLRAWQSGWRWLAVAILPLAVTLTLLLTLGRTFLATTSSFGRGALNLPVGPYPHTIIFLFALVWLVPFGMGRLLNLHDVSGARFVALYAIAIAFTPAALGRSDPLHVFFNGAGLLVLSLVVISAFPPKARLAWIGALVLLVFWSQYVNQRFFQRRTTVTLANTVVPRLPLPLQRDFVAVIRHRGPDFATLLQPQPEVNYRLDVRTLNEMAAKGCVSTPMEISPSIETQLDGRHLTRPGFYAYWVNMVDLKGEARSIRDTDRCPWALVPYPVLQPPPPLIAQLAALQGYRLPYRIRNQPLYSRGEAFAAHLAQSWVPVRHLGPYLLYRQKAAPAPETP